MTSRTGVTNGESSSWKATNALSCVSTTMDTNISYRSACVRIVTDNINNNCIQPQEHHQNK